MIELTKLNRRIFLATVGGAIVNFTFFKSSQLLSSETSAMGLKNKFDDEFIVVGGWVLLKKDLIG